jgi:glutamate--cysteine ligase
MDQQRLTPQDLGGILAVPPGRRRRIGVEIELSLLDPETGLSLPYEGPASVGRVFEELRSAGWGELIVKHGHVTGVRLPDGGRVAFENGGALEYCSPPVETLVEVAELLDRQVGALAAVAGRCGGALIAGGLTPFAGDGQIRWMPKGYEQILLAYFRSLGDAGRGGPAVMARTTSAQVTLDYVSADDLHQALRAGVLLTPVVVALFANSPIEHGRPAGALCRRMQHWASAAPARSGFIPPVLEGDFTLGDWVDWAADLVMVYHETLGGYVDVGGRTFRQILDRGFPGGDAPTSGDWRSHLCQVFTDVRLRETLEFRAADTPPRESLPAVPAFFVGLLYDPRSRAALTGLLERFTPDEHRAALAGAARDGLQGRYGGEAMIDVAREVLGLARDGLRRRFEAGLEPRAVTDFLAPLEEIVGAGRTFAEPLLWWWERHPNPSPAQFVDTFSIRG